MTTPRNNDQKPRNDGAFRNALTIAQFRQRHRGCKVGYPSPSFPFIMMSLCAAFIIMLIQYVIHLVRDYKSIEDATEVIAGFGAIFLSMGVGAGVYATALRLGEVFDWIRFGRNMFAIADDELLLVDERGESVLLPIASITKLAYAQNTIEIKVNADYPADGALSSVVCRVFSAGGDGPSAPGFYKALEPRVKKLAPQAELIYREMTLFS